jgi:RHS repeat-associated protein
VDLYFRGLPGTRLRVHKMARLGASRPCPLWPCLDQSLLRAHAPSLAVVTRAKSSCAWVRCVNYPFLTQKERDIETGLDYFLARYYSSTQGRFTSPDEFTGGPDELYMCVKRRCRQPTFYSEPNNPQSLNKYQYTYNNPLRYTEVRTFIRPPLRPNNTWEHVEYPILRVTPFVRIVPR